VEAAAAQDKVSFSRPGNGTLLVRLAGSWTITQELTSADEVLA
jgi:hypothetical protein